MKIFEFIARKVIYPIIGMFIFAIILAFISVPFWFIYFVFDLLTSLKK